MKQICAIVLSFLLLGIPGLLYDTANAPQGIATRSDLMRIAENPGGSYVLTADIDLGDAAWTPIPFSGTLDGAGHTIGNLTVVETGAETAVTLDGNRRKFDAVFGGLFSVVTDAEIKNLRLLNAEIRIDTDQNCFTGAIAGYASETVFSDCIVSTRNSLTISSVNAGVGGILGYNRHCLFKNCTVEAELLFIDRNPDVLCEEFLGGVYANGCGSISDCTVYTRGYADIYGYAHNGGVVGMFKRSRDYNGKIPSIRDSSVDAEIRFFEVTPSRRAYCNAIIGEDSAKDCYLTHNKTLHFDSTYYNEAIPTRPEACESPTYTEVVTEPTCQEWGYTTYTCNECGYTYRDDYTLPRHNYREEITEPASCVKEGKAVYTCVYCGDSYSGTIPAAGHTPGEWITVKEPTADAEGEEAIVCTACGEVLDTRPIPAVGPAPEDGPIPVRSIQLEETVIELHTGETAALEIMVEPFNAADSTVHFESADPSVVRVDDAGHLTALYPGTSTIRVYSADGNAEAFCSVLVTALPQQEEEHSPFSWLRCG